MFGDVWSYNFQTSEWTLRDDGKDTSPGPRVGHCAVMIPSGRMLIFGGFANTTTPMNDMWEFTLSTSTWKKIEVGSEIPSPRGDHSCVLWNGAMILFGGVSDTAYYNDLWMLDISK
jgi:N-acetylneuraminic acid mutarotase